MDRALKQDEQYTGKHSAATAVDDGDDEGHCRVYDIPNLY